MQLLRNMNCLLEAQPQSRRRHLAWHTPIIVPVYPQVFAWHTWQLVLLEAYATCYAAQCHDGAE